MKKKSKFMFKEFKLAIFNEIMIINSSSIMLKILDFINILKEYVL